MVVGRLLPAGRVPVLLAAGALDYPWRRLLPAAAVGCLLWAIAYTLLGVVSGGLFDSPVLATVVATSYLLGVSGVMLGDPLLVEQVVQLGRHVARQGGGDDEVHAELV